MLWSIIKAAFGGLFGPLFARWFPRKDPAKEGLKHEVTAQRNEAKNLATPAPAWHTTVDEL